MFARALFLFGLMLLTPASAAPSVKMYCCSDANGRRVCGDQLPQQCYDRAYREISPSTGRVREVAAPLTAEERARKEVADKIRREEDLRALELRRRDAVLLESYSTVGEIERRRDVTVGNAEKEIEALQFREKELVAERSELKTRLDGAKGKKATVVRIQQDIAANASELETLQKVIVQKQKDADTIRARYEEDRRRFIELTAKVVPQASAPSKP